jgi:hypothetical protein
MTLTNAAIAASRVEAYPQSLVMSAFRRDAQAASVRLDMFTNQPITFDMSQSRLI